MAYNKIKFDEIKVDTKLAEEYLKGHSKITSKGYNDKSAMWHGSYLLHYSDYIKMPNVITLINDVSEVPKKLYNLAKKVEENIELFCQLEYLMRKIPIADTKNIDMPLLINHLLYSSSGLKEPEKITIREIVMDKETPLFNLGCIAQSLMSKIPYLVIECYKETAVVCALFTDLCYEVGLEDKIKLAILRNKPPRSGCLSVSDLKDIGDFRSGCLGIVTCKSDLESAVDTFLASSERFPWHIKKVMVQESVAEQFKKALEWKAELKKSTATSTLQRRVEAQCTNVYSYEGKLFVYEFTGPELDNDTGVTVIETYRTAKELISLVKDSNHFSVSLWSSDLAESNEIAFSISSNIVWINDYLNFKGPPKTSHALFSIINAYFVTALVERCSEVDEANELRDSWLKLDVSKREELVRNALQSIPADMEMDCEVDSFADVGRNSVCLGIEMAPGLMETDKAFGKNLISFIVKGGGLIIYLYPKRDENDLTKRIFEALKEIAAPVVSVEKRLRLGDVRILIRPIYRTKAVWSNFGTIFAN